MKEYREPQGLDRALGGGICRENPCSIKCDKGVRFVD